MTIAAALAMSPAAASFAYAGPDAQVAPAKNPDAQVAPAKNTDETLKDRIAFRLDTDPVVKKYDVKVKVDNGVATLSGDVASNAQKAQAAKLAKVAGIRRVDNEIAVDVDVDKSLGERMKNGLSKTGEQITDAWITTKVKWFFVGEDVLKGSDIDVDTKDNVVTLSGTVPSRAARTRAVALAKSAEGVKDVVDRMSIATSF